MSFIPPKIVCHGDENKCAYYMGPAREFLRRTVHSMSFQDLKQLEDSKRFSDGTVIHCVHRFGESVINIYCPYDVPVLVEEEEDILEGKQERKAHFFVRYIAPQEDSDPDLPPPPRAFDAAWVWFDRDQVYGTQVQVFHAGQSWGQDVAAPVPPDAVTNVGAELPIQLQKITTTTTQENFGGKAFELSYSDVNSNSHTKRYASYTGNVPLLFREGELLYKGAPCLETYQDPDTPAIYMANMHKMIVQNDKHVAWYYFKQEPYFVESIRGEMDMRFTVCTLDLVTIVGDEMEVAVPTPRAKMRGGGSTGPKEAQATRWNVTDFGQGSISLFNRTVSLAQWLSDWSSPWAGWFQIMQMPQGMNMLLDVKEIDTESYADDAKVTLYLSSADTLREITYSLHPDDTGDMGFGFGYSYGGYQEAILSTPVLSTKSWVWTKEGFEQWDSLEFEFTVDAHKKWPAYSTSYWDDTGDMFRRIGLFGYTACSLMEKRRYGGTRGHGGETIYMPWAGSIAYGIGFHLDIGQCTGIEFRVFKKYIAEFSPFQCERLQRYYKHGGFGWGYYSVGDGWIWGDGYPGYNEPGGHMYSLCSTRYYDDRAPFTFRWQYCGGAVNNIGDTNDFNFLWHETYNDPWGTGCQMVMPNIFIEKGRKKNSSDNSSFKYNQQLNGPWNQLVSEFGATEPPHWASKADAEAWYGLFSSTGEPIPYSVQGEANPATWEPITGYMSGGGERRDSSWGASEEDDETILHCSDGEAAFTLPADAWEYYFMDDRSVDDEPQGVFLACKTATTWRFFHFWEGAGTIKEVTNEIWEGLGFTTPQQRASIQCIGVI